MPPPAGRGGAEALPARNHGSARISDRNGCRAGPRHVAAEHRADPGLPGRDGFKPSAQPGMPGLYPGRVVTVHSPKSIDEATERVDVPTVQRDDRARHDDADGRQGPARQLGAVLQRARLRRHQDQLLGAPGAMSMPDVVAEIVRNLMAVGVKPTNIVIHERGGGQILLARYEQFVPAGVRVESANTWLGFDPDVYVEANFFGEDDTRSYPAADGHRAVHEDHQRAEHEGPRRVGRDGLSQEHRLRRVRQRRAVALPGRRPRR